MASASMKDIKRRIKSIENTQQITKAMELVASSKLKRAKERAVESFPYFNALYEVMCEISSDQDFNSIFLDEKDIKGTLVIVIAGDRGLAGGFNSNINKLALEKCIADEKKGRNVSVITIGRKAVDFFEKYEFNKIASYTNLSEKATIYDTEKIAHDIITRYKKGEFSRVVMIYTTFVSQLVQTAQEITLLPVENLINSGDRSITIYEPSAETVFDKIVPTYLSGLLYGAITDSFAAEQASRRNAMESATGNAEDMIDSLSLVYNRARQAKITQELTEIVSGSLNS